MADEAGQSEIFQVKTNIYTDTLARLYLQQGFVDKALHIYHHLAKQQPDNLQLYEKIVLLEQQLEEAMPDGQAPRAPSVAPASPHRIITQDMHQRQQVMKRLERWLQHLQKSSCTASPYRQ